MEIYNKQPVGNKSVNNNNSFITVCAVYLYQNTFHSIDKLYVYCIIRIIIFLNSHCYADVQQHFKIKVDK